MPFDKFGIPYFYPSKAGGFNYESSDDIKNDDACDFSAEFSFSGNTAIMHPNGPTDFGVGRNIKGFSDSIGGCKMDFKATAARGYAYKANDVRDLEFKALLKADGISSGNGFSISACTGHHTGSNCCQGFAYMCTTEITDSPSNFRFRKETVHVEYTESPEGAFTHSKCNFRINGVGRFVGIGFCRYNKPVSGGTSPKDDNVVLEVWFNPDPDNDIKDWTMLKRIEDKTGKGWTGSKGKCNGDNDQVGVWSGAQNRLKTNSTAGTIRFKAVTFREIDAFGTFEEPPPGPGGGGGSAVQRWIKYAMVSGTPTTYLHFTSVTGHEIVETITDPDPLNTFGGQAWGNPITGKEISDPCENIFTAYADGLDVEGYWSNSDDKCVVPGLTIPDTVQTSVMTNRKGGEVLSPAKIYLIYWGLDWSTRATTPVAATLTDKIQNKMLNSDNQYFNKLSQYGVSTPTWGGAVFNTTFPIPSGNIPEQKGRDCIVDTFQKGLLPIPTDTNEDVYVLYVPVGKDIVPLGSTSTPGGFHDIWHPSLTPPPTPCPTGFHRNTAGACIPDTITCLAGQHEENGVCIDDTPPGGDPNPPSEITGVFTLKWDINITRTSPCSGSTGGGGGGGSAGTPFFQEDPDGSDEGNALNDYRSAIYEAARLSTSVMINKLCVGVDVYMKKVASPTGNATIVQRTSNGTLEKTFGSIDVSTLTTSYVKYTFGPITNTDKKIAKGTRIGVEFSTGTATDYIYVARNKPGGFDAQSSCKITKEGGGSVTAEDYDMCGVFYEL